MKKILAIILILPFSVQAQQPNKSAPVRKKKNVKELRIYEGANDSVPATTFYYNREGCVFKQVRIENDSYEDGKWTVETEIYDSLGRMSKAETRYALGTDPDKMQFSPGKIKLSTWKYFGDTMSFRIDSAWGRDGEIVVTNSTLHLHWTKHPAPSPRPIFWQDSLCSSTIYEKYYEYHFAKPGDRIPSKSDSVVQFEETKNFIQNGKLYHVKIFHNLLDSNFTGTETTAIFTLNPVFDTITETRAELHTPAFLRNNPGFKDEVEITSIQFYETSRSGNKVKWIKEASLFKGQRFEYGKKQLENIWGFPEEDYSLSYYYEAWEYNSGDIEALTIRFYDKYYKVKSRKEFIYGEK